MDNLLDLLDYIKPSELDYQEWVNVGMALKHEGFTAADWDKWSRADRRYHPGECESKWSSFNGTGTPVAGGTIYQMAKERGYQPRSASSAVFDWDSEINVEEDGIIVGQNFSEGIKLTEPTDWQPAKQIITYLETLFEASENVGYVTETWEKKDEDGSVKYLPTKGSCSRTAGELIEELNKCNGDIGAVLGDYNPAAGAWIRFNPLDGKGVKNENVTDFRYALVESDSMALEQQNAVIRELELPVAMLVYSGGKSVHAIVKVDAPNYDEYRKRVDYLYNVCHKNGLDVDKQNRNPSRLSRLPGVERKGNKQYIIDTNIGKDNWNDWKDWIESINDDLPDPETLSSEWNNLPELSPPLIDGVLRQGHKMLIAGPSKAGKSYALIELCAAVAEGKQWLGFNCTQGKILYVNLELDRASCLHRFKDVYTALHFSPDNIDKIDIWNLRGKSVPMDKLAPKLIRRAAKKNYIAVVIDPIYKVITGDENSADQMAHFCNQFDKVCTELGCAVIYCHHHSKGAQGGKRSVDRASGSGVFARDPDALLDLTELELTDGIRSEEENKLICKICLDWILRFNKTFAEGVSQDDLLSAKEMREHAQKELPAASQKLMNEELTAALKALQSRTAWRIEGTLREFPKLNPINLWFDYPIHRQDISGVLKNLEVENERPPWQKAVDKHKEKSKEKSLNKVESFIDAYNSLCIDDDLPTMQEIATLLGNPLNTVRDWAKLAGYAIDKNTGKVIKQVDTNNIK